MLERQGSRAWLSTYAPQLGRSLCALGRYDEAEPLAQLGRELGGEQDVATQMLWRQVQARVHAHRGEHAPRPSSSPARRSRSPSGRTRSTTRATRSATSPRCSPPPAAGDEAAALEQALERYERKKNLAMLAQMRPKLEGLRKAAPA